MKNVLVLSFSLFLISCSQSNNQKVTSLETKKDSISYSIGMEIGMNFQSQSVEINTDFFSQGFHDTYTESTTLLEDSEMRKVTQSYRQELRLKQDEKRKQQLEENKVGGEKFLSEKPDARSTPILLVLAQTWRFDDPAKARGLVKEANRSEETVEGYVLLGELEQVRNNGAHALTAYQSAIKLDGSRSNIRYRLAALYLARNETDKAVVELESALDNAPQFQAARTKLADIYRMEDKPAKALHHYKLLMRYGRPASDTLLIMGKMQLYDLQDVRGAIATFNRVLSRAPERADAHYFLGICYKAKGNLRGAIRQFERYLELSPTGEFTSDVKDELANLKVRR